MGQIGRWLQWPSGDGNALFPDSFNTQRALKSAEVPMLPTRHGEHVEGGGRQGVTSQRGD